MKTSSGFVLVVLLSVFAGCASDPTPREVECPPDRSMCDGACVDTLHDNAHCGRCATRCFDDETCQSGACRPRCPVSFADCNRDQNDGCEVSLLRDRANCGACGAACPSGVPCDQGRCGCAPGATVCGASCADLRSDERHCGSCDHACATGEVCSAGVCVSTCHPPATLCDGRCVDVTSDPANCGACRHSCAPGQGCSEGECVVPCVGLTRCGSECVNLSTNGANCGRCGHTCAPGDACSQGTCVSVCGSRALCGDACVDLNSDRANCGACGVACLDRAHSIGMCTTRRCAIVCDAGFGDCNGDLGDGCEASLDDVSNCGACSHACAASERCAVGRCLDTTGLGSCGASCADLRDDSANCGACGHVCAADQTCVAGRCACPPLTAMCDGRCVDLSTDRAHCGACETACGDGRFCIAGRCQCPPGWADCGGVCRDLQNDSDRCGACDTPCDGSHVCVEGRCEALLCDPPYWYAVGRTCVRGVCIYPTVSCHEGCTALGLDTACRACGDRCPPGTHCHSGDCTVTTFCYGSATLCGGECVDTQTDAHNCGACGHACGAREECDSGVCRSTCSPDDAVCDGVCRAIASDVNHCGACGHACGDAEVCVSGRCVTATPSAQRSCAVAGTPGCGLVEIGGGVVDMGQAGRYEASPVQRGVRVSSFAMDAYEVSVARFRAFWNARSRDGGASVRSRPVAYPDGGSIAWSGSATEPAAITPTASHPEWLTWTPTPRGYEAHPIVGVTWWTAMEFCAWDGGRLPTEAEWEYAARGRVSRCDGLFAGRDFPWGDATPARPCTLAQLDGCGRHDGRATAPVGSFAPWGGLYDMAGNAFELTADVYAPFTYVPCWPGIAQVNPRCQQWLRANHVIRGGSFATSITYAQSARRDADLSYTGTGFRCARSR